MKSPACPSSSNSVRTLGTGNVAVAAVALVVSGSTLVTDFTGFAALGAGFAVSVVIGMMIVIPVVFSASDVAVAHPLSGGIYQFVQSVIPGNKGETSGFFLALLFLGVFLVGATGETMAAAHALRSLLHSEAPAGLFAVGILAAAVIPNLFGLRRATWITGLMLVAMLGIRWFFGVSGFLGISGAGEWHIENLVPTGDVSLGGSGGVLSQGIALGFWSFVGIEGACGLVGETKNPRRAIPRGLIIGMVVILATTLFMGLGVSGCLPSGEWKSVVNGPAGDHGQAPHLAVGELMFGATGHVLMAVASIASTLSTLLIAMAAVPRMVSAIGRDGHFPAAIARAFAATNCRTGTPVAATLTVAGLLVLVSVCFQDVLESLRVAAYLWFIRHLIVHGLAIANRASSSVRNGVLGRTSLLVVAGIGSLATACAFLAGFSGSHAEYLPRVGLLVAAACAIVLVSKLSRRFSDASSRATDRLVSESRARRQAGGVEIVNLLVNRWKFALKNPGGRPNQTVSIGSVRPVPAHSELGLAR